MDPPPPLNKINILWSNCVTAPPKIKHFTVLHCNRPPLAGTSQRMQTGLGLGVQTGQGQGQVELGLWGR